MLLPALRNARDTAKSVVCMNSLKQIGLAHMLYVNDWDGWSPTLGGSNGPWATTLLPYLDYSQSKTPEAINCPEAISRWGYPIPALRSYTRNLQGATYNEPIKLSSVRNPSIKFNFAESAPGTPTGSPPWVYGYTVVALGFLERLEYRHANNSRMNLLFYDGHVESVSSIPSEAWDLSD